jgi:hypothetical protein
MTPVTVVEGRQGYPKTRARPARVLVVHPRRGMASLRRATKWLLESASSLVAQLAEASLAA